MERPSTCDPGLAVLSLMAEYHDCANAGAQADRGRPARARLIEELLVPDRIKPGGVQPVPVQMDLHRPVQLSSQRGDVAGATLSVSIDSVEVALAPEGRYQIKLRAPVVLSIQTGRPRVWWKFLGKVTHVGRERRTLTVRLLRTLGCQACPAPSHESFALGRPWLRSVSPPGDLRPVALHG